MNARVFLLTILVSNLPLCLIGQDTKKCTDSEVKKSTYDVKCNGLNDGRIILDAIDQEFISFQLVNIADNKIFRDFTADKEFKYLTSGNYRIIALKANQISCKIDAEIKSPDVLRLETKDISPTQPSKELKDGSLSVRFSGGTPNYTLKINRTDNSINQTMTVDVSKSKIIDQLSAGIYTLSITDSKGCESNSIQYELSVKNNFGYKFIPTEKTCTTDATYRVILNNGNKPFDIKVKKDDAIIFSEPKYQTDDFSVDLKGFGKYELTIKDQRNIPVSIPFNYQDLQCNINATVTITDRPSLINLNNGKVKIGITDGSPPFKVVCYDQKNGIEKYSQLNNLREHEVSNLSEGSYNFTAIDKYGRTFNKIEKVKNNYLSATTAKSNFETKKHELLDELYKCQCNLDRLENTQKGIRVTVSILGLAGTIASAGAGSLVGGIISGLTTTGGTLTNEYASDNKIAVLQANYNKYKEIKSIFESFPSSSFDESNWTTETVQKYEKLLVDINREKTFIDNKYTIKCKTKKLKEKYNWQ
jgi:hypothetical protein